MKNPRPTLSVGEFAALVDALCTTSTTDWQEAKRRLESRER